MIQSYTHKFTRDELIGYCDQMRKDAEAANKPAAYRDGLEAVQLILECYPLAQVAPVAVQIVLRELRERGGFREVFESLDSPLTLQETLTKKVANSVVYTEPMLKTPETDDLDLA